MLSRICKSVKCLEKIFSKNFLAGKNRGRRALTAWYKKRGTYGKKALRRSCAAGQIVSNGYTKLRARRIVYFFKLK